MLPMKNNVYKWIYWAEPHLYCGEMRLEFSQENRKNFRPICEYAECVCVWICGKLCRRNCIHPLKLTFELVHLNLLHLSFWLILFNLPLALLPSVDLSIYLFIYLFRDSCFDCVNVSKVNVCVCVFSCVCCLPIHGWIIAVLSGPEMVSFIGYTFLNAKILFR